MTSDVSLWDRAADKGAALAADGARPAASAAEAADAVDVVLTMLTDDHRRGLDGANDSPAGGGTSLPIEVPLQGQGD